MMASFTTRPVKAGLPTLFEIQEAAQQRPHRLDAFRTIALVVIADKLAAVVEQLKATGGSPGGGTDVPR